MKCIYCGCEDSKVIDSRSIDENNSIKRRRECSCCGRRFTTFEMIESTPVLVIKKNGDRQVFSASKVKNGIIRSCEKRPVTMEQIDNMVSNIEMKIQQLGKNEIESTDIGEMVMAELEAVDKVSYIRFASVYKQFEDISKFREFFEMLSKETK